MGNGTIGLDEEHRSDHEVRAIFVAAHDLAVPFMDEDGNWLSSASECLATEALEQRFPEIAGTRLMAVLATIAAVRASGRKPVD